MTSPKGNSEFCLPSTLNVPIGFAWENIESLTETTLNISLGASPCHWHEQIPTKILAILDSQKNNLHHLHFSTMQSYGYAKSTSPGLSNMASFACGLGSYKW